MAEFIKNFFAQHAPLAWSLVGAGVLFVAACAAAYFVSPKVRAFCKKHREIITYVIFGVLTTVVSFVTAGIAKRTLEAWGASGAVVADVSTVFSWVCAVTFAYVTNRRWVFDSKAHGFKSVSLEALRFYGGRVFTLVLETVIMDVFAARLGLDYWLVKIAANVNILILNFVISKLLVFRKK